MKILKFTSFKELTKNLANLKLDQDEALYIFPQDEFIKILNSYLSKKLSENELIEICELLECKDGVDFENETVKEGIHLLANYMIHTENLNELVTTIKNQFS